MDRPCTHDHVLLYPEKEGFGDYHMVLNNHMNFVDRNNRGGGGGEGDCTDVAIHLWEWLSNIVVRRIQYHSNSGYYYDSDGSAIRNNASSNHHVLRVPKTIVIWGWMVEKAGGRWWSWLGWFSQYGFGGMVSDPCNLCRD